RRSTASRSVGRVAATTFLVALAGDVRRLTSESAHAPRMGSVHVTATAKILRVLNSWRSDRIAEDARPTDHGVPNRLEGRERECSIYVDLHVRRIALTEQIEVVDKVDHGQIVR